MDATAGDGAQEIVGTRLATWLRRIVVVLAVLALIPIALTPIYAWVPPPSMLMLRDLASFEGYRRAWVSFDDISPNLIRAVVAGEDGQFCQHDGVDWVQMREVLDAVGDGGPSRGASTITMQTVKNLFLWNSRSYLRKGLEIPLALYADLVWSKRRTIEIYLNIAEFGPHLYGAEAAARAYFGKPASRLSRHEAALLAATLPNPALRNPLKPTRAQKRYAKIIERRLGDIGAYLGCLKR